METQRLLVVVLLLCVSQTQAEVVQKASDCNQFFLEGSPPDTPEYREASEGSTRYKMICQTYKDERTEVDEQTFFTLYDTENRIPVYSAFRFTGTAGRSPHNDWNIEPQLEDKDWVKQQKYLTWDENMQQSDGSTVFPHQAGEVDYKNAGLYTRGHLFPDSYGNSENARQSTYTLTNIVPQEKSFNEGSWRRMEESVKTYMTGNCVNNNDKIEGYVVTGAVPSELKPGAEPGSNLLKKRVNIPSAMWSAYCCYNSKSKQWLSGAYMGENVAEERNVINVKIMPKITLNDLQNRLGKGTKLFKPAGCSGGVMVIGID